MPSNFRFRKIKLLLLMSIFMVALVNSQNDTSKWKLQLAIGVNNPIDNGKNDGYYPKDINFPSINLGVQHMFTNTLGAKLDLGYSRSSNANGSKPFKLNYTRVNPQIVYSFYELLTFLPPRLLVVGHAGPGISITKPLNNFIDNKYTYLNALGGLEFHYGISRQFSVFTDVSYAYSFSNKEKYNVNVDGFSFNGDLFCVTFGISVSLSGCYFCN